MKYEMSNMECADKREVKIVLAGNCHGGVVALKSLQDEFVSIEVITEDDDIVSMLRTSDKIIKTFTETDVKLVVCAGFHSIVQKEILEEKTIINTHPSLLPKYRGMHGLVWGMLNFEEELGFSIHLMNEYIDDGDILEQFRVNYNGETSQEIMKLFDDYVEKNLGRVVRQFIKKEITPIKQNKKEATWVAKRNIEDCIIDFNKDNKYIDMLFKALVRPYPLPMIKVDNKLYEVNGYELISIKYETHIGRVVNIEDGHVYIKTKDGLLIIDKLIDFDTKELLKAPTLFKIGKRLWK